MRADFIIHSIMRRPIPWRWCAVRTAMQAVFAEEIGATPEDINSTSVSSTWGKTITDKAIFALSVFLVLVALFIAWRLEWRMAIAAIIYLAAQQVLAGNVHGHVVRGPEVVQQQPQAALYI